MVENWVTQIISWLPELFWVMFKRFFLVINTKFACFPFDHVLTYRELGHPSGDFRGYVGSPDRITGRIWQLGDRLFTALWECQIGFHVALHSWWNVWRHHCKTSNVKITLSSLSNDKQTALTYPLYSADMEPTDGTLQEQEIPASNMTATHLRFTILSGYDHFCAVHKIHVDGTAVHWNNPSY